jgi:hypothetical protein
MMSGITSNIIHLAESMLQGVYVVTAQLPEWKGEFEYNLKHINESYERIAR